MCKIGYVLLVSRGLARSAFHLLKMLFAMLRLFLLLLVGAGMFGRAHAWQRTGLVRGYVEDAESRERLVGAHVYEWHSGRGAVTDNYGYFALQVPADTALRLRVSYTGYQTVWASLPAGIDTLLTIRMQRGEALSEVVVQASRAVPPTTIDRQTMSIEQIGRMPVMFGEADVFKALSLLPGVQPGQEGQSAFFVRGGSRDQNLVLLDGVPLYFTTHFAGFFSAFNPDALKQVQLYKGGFPARFGGRLSSVLELTMKEGHMRRWQAKGGVGLLSGRLAVEGPIVKDRVSVLLAARRTWPDLLIFPLIFELADYEEDERVRFWFRDLNLKANWVIDKRNRLFASGYLGRDYYNFNLREVASSGDIFALGSETKWDNGTFSLRWQSLLGDALAANWVVHYSHYAVDLLNNYNYVLRDSAAAAFTLFSSKLRTLVRERGLSAAFRYVGFGGHELHFGGSSVQRRLHPFEGQVVEGDTTLRLWSDLLLQAEHALFASDRWQRGRWTIDAGVRLAGVTGSLLNTWAPELRLKVALALGRQRSAWLAFDQMRQYLHLAQSETLSLPTERWLPATPRFPPERAWQLSAGVALPEVLGGRIDAGLYYKRMYHLITWADGISFARPREDWEADLVVGKGLAWGVECQWQRQTERWQLVLAATLSRSWRQFAEKNGGKRFPHLYDRPVALNAHLLWRLSKRVQLSAFWTLSSGIPQTLLERRFNVPVDWLLNHETNSSISIYHYAYEYSELNGFRLPPHHRLDISARWHKKKAHWERWWVVGLYNALLRANVIYVNYDASSGKYVGYGIFPVMPFVAFEFAF